MAYEYVKVFPEIITIDDLEYSNTVTEEDVLFLENLQEPIDDFSKRRAELLCGLAPVDPWQIIAITFTNKAANELKERLGRILGPQAQDVWAMTFHSACCRILRRDIECLGYTRSFTIYDTADSERVMKAQCDTQNGANTIALLKELRRRIESEVELPEGYELRLFGEEESREESNAALVSKLPIALILIFIVLLLLFGNLRDPVVVLVTVPLIFVGVMLGLGVTGKMFDFFSLLGLLGLVGMNIKNAVILISRIREYIESGVVPSEAVVAAVEDRFVPVVTASATTVLGLTPLLFDSMTKRICRVSKMSYLCSSMKRRRIYFEKGAIVPLTFHTLGSFSQRYRTSMSSTSNARSLIMSVSSAFISLLFNV